MGNTWGSLWMLKWRWTHTSLADSEGTLKAGQWTGQTWQVNIELCPDTLDMWPTPEKPFCDYRLMQNILEKRWENNFKVLKLSNNTFLLGTVSPMWWRLSHSSKARKSQLVQPFQIIYTTLYLLSIFIIWASINCFTSFLKMKVS